MARTTALIAAGTIGVVGAGCGNGSGSTADDHPTALPSGLNASASLCRTYFGSPVTIAREFRVASLMRTRVTNYQGGHVYVGEVFSDKGTLTCRYIAQGSVGNMASASWPLYLSLTTDNDMEGSSGGATVAFAQAGKVFASALTFNPYIHVSQTNQAWLRAAAARAAPPK